MYSDRRTYTKRSPIHTIGLTYLYLTRNTINASNTQVTSHLAPLTGTSSIHKYIKGRAKQSFSPPQFTVQYERLSSSETVFTVQYERLSSSETVFTVQYERLRFSETVFCWGRTPTRIQQHANVRIHRVTRGSITQNIIT